MVYLPTYLMKMIQDKDKYNKLYDFYFPLLTDKQRLYFEMSYFEDYTLQEIADEFKISRNAVFDQIKKTLNLLLEYESKLKLYEKYQKRNEIYDRLNINDEELRNIK